MVEKADKAKDNGSVIKALAILDVLFRNFFHGYAASELAEATGFSRSDITRYVQTLESAGWVERIAETNRIRVSHKLGQKAVQIMRALDAAAQRVEESKQRLTRGEL